MFKHRIQFSRGSPALLKIVPDLIESNFVVTHFSNGVLARPNLAKF